METLIRNLIEFAIGPVRNFVNTFRNAVLRLWHLLVDFFGGSRVAWVWLRQWWNNWTIAHWYGLLSVYEWGRNLIFVRIPRLLDNLQRGIVSWASRLIDDVSRFLQGLIRNVISWASQAIDFVRGLLDQFSRWVVSQVSRILDSLGRLLRRVFEDWATPERLAMWLVGAMFRALWSFFLSNVERVSVALWPMRARIIMSTLGLVERILARVL